MSAPKGLADAGRAVLRIGGAEARDWLQGLVSNDMRRLAPAAPVYAALLSPQGKYLFDFILAEAPDGKILLDVAADRAQALAQRLSLYRLRRAVSITPAPDIGVALVWGSAPPATAPDTLVIADPRDPGLGWRIYAPSPSAALAGCAPGTRADYDALRVALAIPETGVELIPEETFILEAGFDRLHGVDFRKGCYVGQEVTARMRHKTELRKGLTRVFVDGPAPSPGAAITTPGDKDAGTLFTVAGGEGLAHLRFDRAAGEMIAGSARLRIATPRAAD
jgi:folate-binding protein YgfZ